MTLDARGRRAGGDFRRALDELESSEPARRSFARFERSRARKARNRRIGAGLVAAAVMLAAVAFLGRVFAPVGSGTPAEPSLHGLILYGDANEEGRSRWFTVRPDGSERRELGLDTTCAVWFPDGDRILVTHDPAVGPGSPLRPAVVDADGSNLRPLDAARNRDLNLGCGDVSPDGRTVALEGFGRNGHPELDGIYSVRSSDGGGLTRLLRGPVSPPRYSPDGTRLSFFDTKAGVSPTGSGALFVMKADGSEPVRITPWGYAFDDHAWSPDGNWIVFQRPYGQLYIVHPDGSGLHRVPLDLEAGTGALNPSWSPDGERIAFSLQRPDGAEIFTVRPDGTGLRRVTGTVGSEAQHPDWAEQ
jgi:Tol biopolymer transport system component